MMTTNELTFGFDHTRCDKKCIRDIVKKIDQDQKEACMVNELSGCDSPLVGRISDTRPVSFTLCSGALFEVQLTAPNTGETTLFRIEELRGNCVVLRLLVEGETAITCTNQTCVLDLCCVCAIQCFEPINCLLCNNTNNI